MRSQGALEQATGAKSTGGLILQREGPRDQVNSRFSQVGGTAGGGRDGGVWARTISIEQQAHGRRPGRTTILLYYKNEYNRSTVGS